MIGPDPAPWFAGDLGDPWVAAIADALPRGARRIACGGDLPDAWPDGPTPRTIVLHRPSLHGLDADRLRRLREASPAPPRVVLCLGPYARCHQWERWAPLVDVVLTEATATETIVRHLDGSRGRPRSAGPRPRIAVVGGDSALRLALSDACGEAGYPAEPFREWADAPSGVLSLGIVPVLDDSWPHALARAARSRPVVALIGFADRPVVALARARGAVACLDLPCDLADLVFVLDRLSARRLESGHLFPPAPALLKHPGISLVDPRPPT